MFYGIEFMYSRDPLTVKNNDKEQGADRFVEKVLQDANKLKASVDYHEFMDQAKMLVFLKGNDSTTNSFIEEKLADRNDVITCFAE